MQKTHELFSMELSKQQTVRLAECIEVVKWSGAIPEQQNKMSEADVPSKKKDKKRRDIRFTNS
jgi:hypothetical protein